jgi:pyroglutamyl-peptidase
MTKRFLLTSFDTWLQNHKSNSSDDLLEAVSKLNFLPHDLIFLRKLPVDIPQASHEVIRKIEELQPEYILCCGMAATRTKLSLEANARNSSLGLADCQEIILHPTIDLEKLVPDSDTIEISHDCGKFVCEGLYYSVLDYLLRSQISSRCIFVHVPILTENNLLAILEDFLLVIHRLALS